MALGQYKLVKMNSESSFDEKTVQAQSGNVLGFDNDLDPKTYSLVSMAESLRANINITGGGTITFDGGGNLKWSQRFIVISNGRGSHFSTSGYFNIECPTSGTITGVGGASNVTATSNGIPIGPWQALYYILPIGGSSTSIAENFRIAYYSSELEIPDNWILIAVNNGEQGRIHLPAGYSLKLNESINTVTHDAYNADKLDGYHASAFALTSHNHDERYYTETEIQTAYIPTRNLIVNTNGVPTTNLGNPSIAEMAIFDNEFTNKTDFFDINYLSFQTSSDRVTWTDFTVSDTDKRKFVGGDYNANIQIPVGTVYFRIKLRANNTMNGIINPASYVTLNALYIYSATRSNNIKIKIYKKHDSGSYTQHTSSNALINNWPGHVYLPFSTIPFHATAALGSHFHEVFIELEPTWVNSNTIILYKLQLWGGYPATTRNVYGINENKIIDKLPIIDTVNADILSIKQDSNYYIALKNDDSTSLNINPDCDFSNVKIGSSSYSSDLDVTGKLLLEGFEIPNNIYSDNTNGDLHIGYSIGSTQIDGIKIRRSDNAVQIGSSNQLFDLEVKGNLSLNRGTDTSVKISLIDDDTERAYISQDFDVNVNDSRLKIYSYSGIKIGDTGKSLQLNQFTLPTADGTSGYVLATNGAGQLSFIAPPTGTANNAAGNAKEIQFRGASSGEFAASADFTWDNGTAKLLTTRNINASCLNLPNTNTVNINNVHSGIIYKEGKRFIHDFSYGLNDNGITPNGNNLFIGENAGNITTLGKEATLTNQSSNNIGIGKWSLYHLTLGQSNIAIGFNSSSTITSGVDNISIGTNTLLNNIEGNYNIAIGLSALYSNRGNDNIGIGSNALLGNYNADKNIAIGVASLGEKYTGDNNIAIGYYSGKYLGDYLDVYDTFGNHLITGHTYKIAYSGTTSFTSIGSSSNSVDTVFTYNGNAVSGTGAVFPVAENNIFIGNNSGGTRKDISDCIIIGTNTETYYDGVHNAIIIGQSTYDTGSNTVSIGNSAITDNYFNGKLHTTESISIGNDTSTATSDNVGSIRYRTSGNNSYCEMVMQTGASTYAWVIIKQNSW